MLGGRIEVSSEVGRGSRFALLLPDEFPAATATSARLLPRSAVELALPAWPDAEREQGDGTPRNAPILRANASPAGTRSTPELTGVTVLCGALCYGEFAARFPEAADALRQHCAAGDFRGLRRLLARLEGRRDGGFLADLLAGIAKHSADSASVGAVPAARAPVARRVELKSLKYFRRTWSKLSVDRQLSEAFAQAPDNAGPLNSHFLVLRALGLMRDISPEYVGEFVPYVDALLWLDQADSARGATQKNLVRAEAGKKRKPARGKAG